MTKKDAKVLRFVLLWGIVLILMEIVMTFAGGSE